MLRTPLGGDLFDKSEEGGERAGGSKYPVWPRDRPAAAESSSGGKMFLFLSSASVVSDSCFHPGSNIL